MAQRHPADGPRAVALAAAAGSAVLELRPVAGGDLNDAYAADLADGRRLFVKTREGAPPSEYATEAAGLRWLAEPGALRVPEVVAVGETFLALAWVEPGGAHDAEELGRGLALVHGAGAPGFGGPQPMRLGPVVLPDEPLSSWPAFYAERRLMPLVGAARDGGALDVAGAAAVEAVCARMNDLAGPPETPARLHGDLWAGNVLADTDGHPWLIDPAAYGGHREVDLAMLTLFGGGLGARGLAAYEEVAPLADGWRDRVELWQLFPLLVHAVLFGGGYGASAARIARRYAGV
ncbi:MAG: fructosamine kinase family protein [Solirubrobacteraceae bacterium]|nr:fructosamine kinase family protein [Solirubrobacteraceae bacterium]